MYLLSFHPSPTQPYGQAPFGNGELGPSSVTSLRTALVPEEGRSHPRKVPELCGLTWEQGGWGQPVRNPTFSSSSWYHLLPCVPPLGAVTGCPRDTSGQRSPPGNSGCSRPSRRWPEPLDGLGNSLLCLPPPFPSPPPSLAPSSILTELDFQTHFSAAAFSGLR